MARSKQIRKTTRVADASCAIADEMNQQWEVLGRSGLQVRDVEGGVVKIDEVGDKCGDDAWDNLLPTFSMGQADGHDDSEESSSDSGRRGKHISRRRRNVRGESHLQCPWGPATSGLSPRGEAAHPLARSVHHVLPPAPVSPCLQLLQSRSHRATRVGTLPTYIRPYRTACSASSSTNSTSKSHFSMQ